MITSIKQYLASLIHIENEKLKDVELNKKELMATNGWDSLPEKVLIPIRLRDILQRVMNFIEHIPPNLKDPGSTNFQKMEQITALFWDDYWKWLVKNEKDIHVVPIVEHYLNMSPEDFEKVKTFDEDQHFRFFSVHLLQRYAIQQRTETQPSNEPNEPEAA